MAGRFDFLNPGAMMAQGLREHLAEEEARKLRAAAELRAQEDLKLRQQGMKINQEEADAAKSLREAQAAEVARKTQMANAEMLTPGQVLTGEENIPGALKQDQMTLPGRSLPMTTGVMPSLAHAPDAPIPSTAETTATAPMMGPLIMSQSKTGKQTFKGTPAQQEFEKYMGDPSVPDSVRNYMKARKVAGDENLPYQLFEGIQNKPVVRVSHDRTKLELWNKGKWEALTDDVPKDAQMLIEPAESEGQNGRPYVIPIQTAQGFYGFDTRTGTIGSRIADLKPGETAQGKLADAQQIGLQINRILKDFKPEKVGVIAGRLQNLNAKYWGSDPDYARLQAAMSTLKNTVINLRTGAQMSEPEAKRILSEIADTTLPFSTSLERLNNAQDYYEDWLTNRAKLAFGRTTVADVDRMVNPDGATPAFEVVRGPDGKMMRKEVGK